MNQQPLSHEYYYAEEAEQYVFYRLPKALFTNNQYRFLSGDAKILYGLMLDRMGLSLKNGWLDDNGKVFIYFTLEDVQEYMNCQRDKGMKLLAELDDVKGVGLIERVKQGLGKPAIIYVKKFKTGIDLQRSEKPTSGVQDFPTSGLQEKPTSGLQGFPTSGGGKNRPLEVGRTDSNNNDPSNPEKNNIYMNQNHLIQSNQQQNVQSASSTSIGLEKDGLTERNNYCELIKDNIEYDILLQQYGRERMEETLNLLADTVCSKRDYITIAADDYPKEVVKSRLLKLNSSHIEYVFDCIDKNTTKVHNIKKYLLAALYNAPTTMDSYYRAEVNHDLYGGGDY